MLIDKLKKRESGIVLYGITPPKKETPREKIGEIAQRQILKALLCGRWKLKHLWSL